MFNDKDIEQIKKKKMKDMIEAAQKDKNQVLKDPIILTDNNFNSTVSTNELLVVDFWAPWCGPCRMVGPIIEQLASEYAGKVTFAKMNVDENQVIPNKFGIMGIPTIIVFYQGKVAETIVGSYPKTHIEAAFKRYIKSE